MSPRRIDRFLASAALFLSVLLFADRLLAGLPSEVIEQTVKALSSSFAKEIAEEGLESISKKVAGYANQHGDEAIQALRSLGPKAMSISQRAGSKSGLATQLMAQYGQSSLPVVTNTKLLGMCNELGSDIAPALIRHPGICVGICEKAGKQGLMTAGNLTQRNARRFAILLDDSALTSGGRSKDLIRVIEQFGDRGMDFVWKNKIALSGTVVATAFFLNPAPFIDGTAQLGSEAIRSVGGPLAEFPASAWRSHPVLSVLLVAMVSILIRWKMISRSKKC